LPSAPAPAFEELSLPGLLVLLYYFGPLSGACFIGHQLNAVCREIQLMEDQQPGYVPSFLLG
jgi:hypothetical protein